MKATLGRVLVLLEDLAAVTTGSADDLASGRPEGLIAMHFAFVHVTSRLLIFRRAAAPPDVSEDSAVEGRDSAPLEAADNDGWSTVGEVTGFFTVLSVPRFKTSVEVQEDNRVAVEVRAAEAATQAGAASAASGSSLGAGLGGSGAPAAVGTTDAADGSGVAARAVSAAVRRSTGTDLATEALSREGALPLVDCSFPVVDPFSITNADVMNHASDLLTLMVQQLLKIGGEDAILLMRSRRPIANSRAATLFFLVAASQVR